MALKRLGKQTLTFSALTPHICASAAVVGDMEGAGPLGKSFDVVLTDDKWGEKSWEKAECRMFEESVRTAMRKAAWTPASVDCLLGGDLLNQIVTANYAARQLNMPFLGLYGACSTMSESLLIGSMLIDGGYADRVACTASSHFSTAERQYRYPLEMGSTSSTTAQRTVTGAGSVLLSSRPCASDADVRITAATIGRIVDLGITDASNMGAAMAPAACDTIAAHLADTGRKIEDYDAVVTGDLGRFGTEMLFSLTQRRGIDLSGRHLDCGNMIFHPQQNVDCGGSGCGCSAVVLSAYLLKCLRAGKYQRILFLATGALMSPASNMQGETIPGIAHLVVLERG